MVIGYWNLAFDVAQGGESFDFAQDRELVERPVEPFVIWVLPFDVAQDGELVEPLVL